MTALEKIIKSLPDEAKHELSDYAEFLQEKYKKKKNKKGFKFDWVGGLKDLKDKYTSVELQHKILDMWMD
jgi:Protein of unknown function (DUF2281)